MFIKFVLSNFISSCDNSVGNLGVEAEVGVSLSSSLLQETECTNDWEWHALALTTDLEVLQGSLSLSTPVLVSWDLNRAEGVTLLSVLSWGEDTEETSLL